MWNHRFWDGGPLGVPFWFCAATNGNDYRNATYNHRIKNTTYGPLYGEKKDLSKFRPFGCRAWIHINKNQHEKRKHALGVVEAINLDLASDLNKSAYKSRLYIPLTKQIITTKQVVFDESFFPYHKEFIKRLDEGDDELDILYKESPLTSLGLHAFHFTLQSWVPEAYPSGAGPVAVLEVG